LTCCRTQIFWSHRSLSPLDSQTFHLLPTHSSGIQASHPLSFESRCSPPPCNPGYKNHNDRLTPPQSTLPVSGDFATWLFRPVPAHPLITLSQVVLFITTIGQQSPSTPRHLAVQKRNCIQRSKALAGFLPAVRAHGQAGKALSSLLQAVSQKGAVAISLSRQLPKLADLLLFFRFAVNVTKPGN
jgi:hypothetical protein